MVVLIIIKYYAHTIHSCCQPCVQQGLKMQAQQAYALLPSQPQLGQAHFWVMLHKAAHGSNKAWAHAGSSGGTRKATSTCTHA